jgi:hypothetical protein
VIVTVTGDEPLAWEPGYPTFYLAVVGSRRRNGPSDVDQVAARIVHWYNEVEKRTSGAKRVVIVSGGASQGADRTAEAVAEASGIDLVRFRPRPVPQGSPYFMFVKALHDRNTRVVELAHAVCAQVHTDRTGDTEDAVKKAHRALKPVELLNADGSVTLERAPGRHARRKKTV